MIAFVHGRLYRRTDIHAPYKGQDQGGISTPAQFPIILLFTGEQGAQYGYHDGYQSDGTYWYTGEGQLGDMQFVRGNRAIRDHAREGKTLHLFEYVERGTVRYHGTAQCLGYHRAFALDRDKNPRQAIVFELAVDVSAEGVPDLVPEPVTSKVLPEIRRATFEQLRREAYDATHRDMPPLERKATEYYRSQAIKEYVLRRAGGICEGCGQPAPFITLKGKPYLEPHHIHRRADGGPDHPLGVIALCPNCHKGVHYGKYGKEYNIDLAQKVERIEQGIALPAA
jgi:5-methylcytosine-specific restriction protein A